MPEMRRRGLEPGLLGAIAAGIGVGLLAYNNGRHSVCQFVGTTSSCRGANDAWTVGLVLTIIGAITLVASVLVALTTEPRPVEKTPYKPSLNLWVGLGLLGTILMALLAVSLY